MSDVPTPEELAKIDHRPPLWKGWMYTPAEIKEGIACYGSKAKNLEYVACQTHGSGPPLMRTGNCQKTGKRLSWKV